MGPLRSHPVLTTTAAAAVLAAIVIAVDDMPLMMSARSQMWGLGALHYAEFDRKLPARQHLDWFAGVGTLEPEAPAPVLRPVGGRYVGRVGVTVAGADGTDVRCSDDGTIPTLNHDSHVGPVNLSATTALRCRAFRGGNQPSPTTTHTYVIDAAGTLPVLAVTVHPTNLWNKYTGIHARFEGRGSEWERDAHVELFPVDVASSFQAPGRLRIHGGWTRRFAKKSFRFYYPSAQGTEPAADLLSWPSPSTERAVVLDARERLVNRDGLFQSLHASAGGFTSAKMPVELYVNGDYWGIYFVRERIDEEYLQRRFGPGNYDLLHSDPDRPTVFAGDRSHWDETIRFFETADFRSPATLDRAANLVDLENFTDYWLLNIYAAHLDWPHNNMFMFARREGDDRRWRWISWDSDYTFDVPGLGVAGVTHETLAWATRSDLRHDLRFNNQRGLRDSEGFVVPTLMLRRLLENDAYRARFIDRMSELLATQLRPERVNALLDEVHREVSSDMERDWTRWDVEPHGIDDERRAYEEDMQRVRTFIEQRPAVIREHFRQLASIR